MAYLFQITGRSVFPNAETLLLHPFDKIWKRDSTKEKTYALEDFAYIEFMTSALRSNPFRGYPEDKKSEVISNAIITRDDWIPDYLIIEAMEVIKKLQTDGSEIYQYWLSNKTAAEKMIEFFNNVDVDERDPKTNKPIYKPRDITGAIADAEKMINTLDSLKKKMDEESFEKVRNRGDKEISPFSDPESI